MLNRLPGPEIPPPLKAFIESIDVPLLGIIPDDATLREFEFSGRPLIELGDESPVYRAVARMMGHMVGVEVAG